MRQMLLIVFSVTAIITTHSAGSADTVATCKEPSGYSYYHEGGMLSKKDSGFTKDKITGGLMTLVRIGPKEYDLLFVDASKSITSTKQDGGRMQLLRRGKNDATFLAVYPNSTELFTFYKEENSGSERFDMLQSKGGAMPIHKSTVMTGSCSGLRLNLLD
jgi:hypothetical protein